MKKHKRLQYLSLLGFFIAALITFMPTKSKACCSCLLNAYMMPNAYPPPLYPPALPASVQSLAKDVMLDSWVNVMAKIGNASEIQYVPNSPLVPPLNTKGPLGHRDWIKQVLLEGNDPIIASAQIPGIGYGLRPALAAMVEQLKSVATQQTLALGMFLDAKNQLETQKTLQVLSARTHKNYQTSTGVCEFATHVRSLAATEQKNAINQKLIAGFSAATNLGGANITRDAENISHRHESKLHQYRTKFCDPADNNGNLSHLCQHDYDNIQVLENEDIGAEQAERRNKDIDFMRTLGDPWTINVDFTDTILTHHEEELMALEDNIYNHEIISAIPPVDIGNVKDIRMTETQGTYLDKRAVQAKHSVAENSFNALAAMKSSGAPGSKDFVIAVMENLLGGTNPSATAALILAQDPDDPGTTDFEPSYYAQMEILTKKLLQSPDFYTDLMDKPANVIRKKASLQAISLMQKFDLFKSHLRNEASLSVLLEMALIDMQQSIENQLRIGVPYSTSPGAPCSNPIECEGLNALNN